MTDRFRQARMAALSMAHCTAVARMLRTSGRGGHADKLESALDEAERILGEQVGRETLSAARAWVTAEIDEPAGDAPPLRH